MKKVSNIISYLLGYVIIFLATFVILCTVNLLIIVIGGSDSNCFEFEKNISFIFISNGFGIYFVLKEIQKENEEKKYIKKRKKIIVIKNSNIR